MSWYHCNSLHIDGEENLPKLGLIGNDVLAVYFDRTKSSEAKKFYPHSPRTQSLGVIRREY